MKKTIHDLAAALRKRSRLRQVKQEIASLRREAGNHGSDAGIFDRLFSGLEKFNARAGTVFAAVAILAVTGVVVLVVCSDGGRVGFRLSALAMQQVLKLESEWEASAPVGMPAGPQKYPYIAGDGFNHVFQIYASQLRTLESATTEWWWWILAVRDWREIHAWAFACNFPLSAKDTQKIRQVFSAYKNAQEEKRFLLAMILGKALAGSADRTLDTTISGIDKFKLRVMSMITEIPLDFSGMDVQTTALISDGDDVFLDFPKQDELRDSTGSGETSSGEGATVSGDPGLENLARTAEDILEEVRAIRKSRMLGRLIRNEEN